MKNVSAKACFAKTRFAAIIMVFFLPGCEAGDGLLDYFDFAPPRIISVTPEEAFLSGPMPDFIIRFSKEMNKTSAEQALNITIEGAVCRGEYFWEDGSTMIFRPGTGMIGAGDEVKLSIAASAEDMKGNDLSERFTAGYNAAGESGVFEIEGCSLKYAAGTIEVSDTTDASAAIGNDKYPGLPLSIVVDFSEPIALETLVNAISFSPRLRYRLKLHSPKKLEIILLPDSAQKSCTLFISEKLESNSGIGLSANLDLRLGSEAAAYPEITGISFINGYTGDETEMEQHILNSGIEKDAVLSISLSEVITMAEISPIHGSLLAIDPAVDFVLAPSGAEPSSEWTLSFKTNLEWSCFYNLKSAEKSWSFVVDGPDSTPPSVEGVFWCNSLASAAAFSEVKLNDTLAFDAASDAVLDIEISSSEVAAVSLSSFIEAFSIGWTNNCLTADIKKIEKADPLPDHAREGCEVFRVFMGLEENLNSGIVELSLSNDLSDDLGNRMPENYSIKLNK